MDQQQQLDFLESLLATARRSGADAADAVLVEGQGLSATQRLGKPEAVERSEGCDFGLRVLVGQRQSIVSTTDIAKDAMPELVNRVIAMAKAAPDDPYAGLAEASEIATSWPDIDMFDATEPSVGRLVERAAAAEDAALAVTGITNSEGGEASWSTHCMTLVTSNGFAASYKRSSFSVSAAVLAGEGQDMERDYAWSHTVHETDLEDPATVGREAAERAVRRLNPRRPASAAVPVVFDPRVSGSLVGHLASALNGTLIARGTSFLKDRLDTQVFARGIDIRDAPHRSRGLKSKPFDAEGLATRPKAIVKDGYIRSWFLDLGTARQLELQSTSHASRSAGGMPAPAPGNLFLAAGSVSPDELMADIVNGLYITELMGMSVSMVTGDYSRGCGGFWIENGRISYPVSDVTIAGNLTNMFLNLVPASNLEFKYGIDAPTVRVDGMTVAGPGE